MTGKRRKIGFVNDYEDMRFAPILWPEIGGKCSILLECVVLRTILLHGETGFWIVDMFLQWAGYVSDS